MPEIDGGALVLRHLAESCAQVVAHGLNRLSPTARQAVASALDNESGDVELHIMGLNPLALLVEFVRRDGGQRVLLFRIVPGGMDEGEVRDRRFT